MADDLCCWICVTTEIASLIGTAKPCPDSRGRKVARSRRCHADDLSGAVDQRAAGVAALDGGVGLDQSAELRTPPAFVARGDLAVERRDLPPAALGVPPSLPRCRYPRPAADGDLGGVPRGSPSRGQRRPAAGSGRCRGWRRSPARSPSRCDRCRVGGLDSWSPGRPRDCWSARGPRSSAQCRWRLPRPGAGTELTLMSTSAGSTSGGESRHMAGPTRGRARRAARRRAARTTEGKTAGPAVAKGKTIRTTAGQRHSDAARRPEAVRDAYPKESSEREKPGAENDQGEATMAHPGGCRRTVRRRARDRRRLPARQRSAPGRVRRSVMVWRATTRCVWLVGIRPRRRRPRHRWIRHSASAFSPLTARRRRGSCSPAVS